MAHQFIQLERPLKHSKIVVVVTNKRLFIDIVNHIQPKLL